MAACATAESGTATNHGQTSVNGGQNNADQEHEKEERLIEKEMLDRAVQPMAAALGLSVGNMLGVVNSVVNDDKFKMGDAEAVMVELFSSMLVAASKSPFGVQRGIQLTQRAFNTAALKLATTDDVVMRAKIEREAHEAQKRSGVSIQSM